jgi:FkbM family methyltransferase
MPEPVSFGMVVPSVYGPVLVNRYDTHQTNALIKAGRSPDHDQIMALCGFLMSAPPGAVCLDVGANYGLYALAFARALAQKNGWVHAFEAQRMIAYLAAGTAVLNSVENLVIHHKAVGAGPGRLAIPQFDYHKAGSFGSIEFGDVQKESIGQPRADLPDKREYVDVVALDDLKLENVQLAKIDVEGMEEAVLTGARQLIERDKPVLVIEWIKSDKQQLVSFCKGRGYRVFSLGMNLLCVHLEKQPSYSVKIDLDEL